MVIEPICSRSVKAVQGRWEFQRSQTGNSMAQVFISYADNDRGAAQPIIEAFSQAA
jgi:hypothetical protein